MRKQMIEISVIVPVYNKSKYLSAMLDSVLKQSFSDYEVILIDDGSTDDSGKIADEYSQNDSRIQVYHIENGGVSHARNVGLDMAKGEYITFIDADDTVAENYLENLYTCMTSNKTDLVISGILKADDQGNTLKEIHVPYKGTKSVEGIINEFASVQHDTGIYGFCVAKIFRKQLAEDLRFDEEINLAEDFDFYLRLYDKISTIYFDDQCLYYYLQNADNSSALVSDRQIDYLSQLLIQLRFKDFLESHFAYQGENKSIIENKITTYCYYAIRYADKENIHTTFQKVYTLYQQYKFDLNVSGFRKNMVLYLLKNGHEKAETFFVVLLNGTQKVLGRR